MINIKNLTKKYGGFTAVDDLSFNINKGEIVGLLGPNGAGKTTTMKIITCFMPATEGQVKIAGLDVNKDTLKIRKLIGYLPENAPLYPELNVLEYLKYIAEIRGIPLSQRKDAIEKVIDQCGLKSKIRNEISELSKGYKQRVGLAQALIHDPEILVLDEPTNGLDPNQIIEIRELIKKKKKKKTIILSSHILSEVEATSDRVLIINNGKIVASGTPEELRDQSTGKAVIHVQVEGTPKTEVIAKLEKLKGVKKITGKQGERRGVQALTVEAEADTDLRKPLVHHILKSGYELLEMTREEVSLEDVFIKLTKK